jgi:hypothetical protein
MMIVLGKGVGKESDDSMQILSHKTTKAHQLLATKPWPQADRDNSHTHTHTTHTTNNIRDFSCFYSLIPGSHHSYFYILIIFIYCFINFKVLLLVTLFQCQKNA